MSDFEYWLENEGQYNRAGGGEYEKKHLLGKLGIINRMRLMCWRER